jgi:hypothetical protein
MDQSVDSATLNTFLATAGGVTLIVILSVWSAIWKAIALWKAARRGETAWYIFLLILNTLGILEIIYIFAVAKEKK